MNDLVASALSAEGGLLFDLCSVRSGSPELAASQAVDHANPASGRGPEGERPPKLKDYKIGSRLGAGHDALVHRAIEKSTMRVVALKIMPKEGRSARSLARFRLEGELLSETLRHPHIISARSWFETDKAVCLALEYASGGCLHDYVNSVEPLDEGQLHRIFSQLVSALAFAHAAGYVHHDVKPENVLIMKANLEVKLADWTFACPIGDENALAVKCGSPAYTCPEVFAAAEVSASSEAKRAATMPPIDVWSLGALIYAVSFAALPFGPEPANAGFRFANARSALQPPRSFDFHSLVHSMLRVDAASRITLAGARAHQWFIRTATITP